MNRWIWSHAHAYRYMNRYKYKLINTPSTVCMHIDTTIKWCTYTYYGKYNADTCKTIMLFEIWCNYGLLTLVLRGSGLINLKLFAFHANKYFCANKWRLTKECFLPVTPPFSSASVNFMFFVLPFTLVPPTRLVVCLCL